MIFRNAKKTFVLVAFLILTKTAYSIPPLPPKGYRWVINVQFSDEFNGNELDKTKWKDTYGGWQGRPPAMFIPEAITVKNGNLEIKSGVLDKPHRDYTIFGGAVSSKTYDAFYGYYECRAKASKIAMSTTFWLSNEKKLFKASDCQSDSYSLELDIQEAVGGGTVYPKFRKGMNSNTHYRYIQCGARKEEFISKGTGTELRSEVSDEFHIYGAWWKNANEVSFYANDEFFDNVKFKTDITDKPFDRPMKLNMVTETYDWQPPPPHDDLLNDEINTAYYDWVRSYFLVPIDQEVKSSAYNPIFKENVNISNVDKSALGRNLLLFDYSYKSNADQKIDMVIQLNGEVLQKTTIEVFAGYGHDNTHIKLNFSPEKEKTYIVEVSLNGTDIKRVIEFGI